MRSRILSFVAGALGLLLPATGRSDIPNIINPTGPGYATNVLGETIAFDVEVDNDDSTFVYTWKKNTTTIANPDGQDNHYEKAASTSGDAGAYTCYIANSLGQHSESAPFNLTLWYPPTITTQPQGRVVAPGSNVTFSVQVNTTLAPTNFTYQWQLDGFDLVGATNKSLTLTNVQPDNEGDYTVNIFNGATALSLTGEPTVSTNAHLIVVVPPAITSDPEDQIVDVGDPVQFSIGLDAATDTEQNPATYQWRKNAVNISPASNSTATNSDFNINTTQISDGGTYTVVAKNLGGSVTSNPALLMFLPAITNLTPATDFVATAGSNVTFTVGATGTAPLSYQWMFNEIPIPGAVSNNYILHLGNAGQAGSYSVQVSNTACWLAGSGPEENLGVNLTVLPETNRPSITITNPANGARWSNAVITVRGTATDNGEVEAVRFQVNAGTNIYTAVGTNSWVADFPGIPGSNTITAYSVDYYGNQSTNAVRNIFYVVPSPFTLLMVGKGTVSSNWTGANLEIGRVYRMTMTGAGSGYQFAGWTGGVTTNTTSIDFMMQSNLVIQANFTDVYSPTFAITNPPANTAFSNSPTAIVRGTVTDNSGGAEVRYRLNGGAWAAAAGTNNWQAAVNLSPGTNVFNAYAADAAGNLSATNSLNLVYWLISPLTVQTNGHGTISPNYNGQTLIIGKSYTMTATAATGFKFTGWSGGVPATTNAALTFTMQSNLVIQATFVDSQLPTIAITNPVSNSIFSNSPAVTVKGTASDNSQIVEVRYQLNSDAWGVASGTNSWQAGVTLPSGTNIFRAYSVDAGGNHSTTNSINLIYWLIAPVTVKTNGSGTVSPNYNGQTLILGKSYTMTAAGTNGYVFTNWTGGTNLPLVWLTNGAALKFIMASNLTVQANFADTNKPVLTITNPASNATFSNSPTVTVKGTATDNSKTAEIRSQLNGGAWTVANGTNGWQTDVVLAPGTNVFRAYAVDPSGNYSPTNSINLIYWLIAPLTVQTNGRGTFSPNYNNQTLILGKSYTMTAAGTNGFVFTNWTGGTNLSLTLLTNGAALKFVMQTNLTLRANFADTQKPTLTITNPASAAKFTNSTVQFRGLIGDNGPLTAIYWRLGTNSWTAAALTNNATTNGWTLPVNAPVTGSNTFSAYAVDAAGNRSTTNSLSIVYSGSFALLTVQTNGQGTVTPNYNGQSLGLGQTFTITAAGTNGYAFTNWLGGTNLPLALLTNTPALTFVMRSNLTLQAVFVDVENPVVTVTNTLPGGPLQNLSATLGGFATDNHQVVSVIFRVNSGAWTNAAGLSPWSASFPLVAGTNTFSIYGVDAAGNHSATNTLGTFVALLQPEIGSIIPSGGGGFGIQFPSVAGAVYSLEYKDSLTAPAWLPLGGSVAGNGTVISLSDTNPPAGERFYRLKVVTP